MAADPIPDPVPVLTAAETASVAPLYALLKKDAEAAGLEFVMCRTPVRLQKAVNALAVVDFPQPP